MGSRRAIQGYAIAAMALGAIAIGSQALKPPPIGAWSGSGAPPNLILATGHGVPTSADVHACQDVLGGEVIYTPWRDSWQCEG